MGLRLDQKLLPERKNLSFCGTGDNDSVVILCHGAEIENRRSYPMSLKLPHGQEQSESLPSIHEELLAVITEGKEPDYPGEPGDPRAEAYFADLEAEFSLLDSLNSSEIDSQAESFFSFLRQSWESVSS
jgi:hypothetical protein